MVGVPRVTLRAGMRWVIVGSMMMATIGGAVNGDEAEAATPSDDLEVGGVAEAINRVPGSRAFVIFTRCLDGAGNRGQ